MLLSSVIRLVILQPRSGLDLNLGQGHNVRSARGQTWPGLGYLLLDSESMLFAEITTASVQRIPACKQVKMFDFLLIRKRLDKGEINSIILFVVG